MVSLSDFKKDLGNLCECGLIAIKQGDEDSAQKLFAACKILDPQNTVADVGEGLIALHKMDLKNARTIFERILSKERNWRAQGFLSLTHLLSALKEKAGTDVMLDHLKKASIYADEVVLKADDASSKDLAQSVLNWLKEIQDKATVGPAQK